MKWIAVTFLSLHVLTAATGRRARCGRGGARQVFTSVRRCAAVYPHTGGGWTEADAVRRCFNQPIRHRDTGMWDSACGPQTIEWTLFHVWNMEWVNRD